jgi:hypothetical protein
MKYYGISFVFPKEYKNIFKKMQIQEREEIRTKVREIVDEYALRVVLREKEKKESENVETKELKELKELKEVV